MKIIQLSLFIALICCTTLLHGQSNKLYGVSNGTTNGQPDGYGSIFSFNPDDGTAALVYSFAGVDGSALTGGVIHSSDGYLYGTARYGGVHNMGTIFKLMPDGTNFQKLHDFSGLDGEDATGGLVEGPDGFLYGTTISGGTNQVGVVYKIAKNGTGFQKLMDFDYYNSGFSTSSRPTLVGSYLFLVNAQGGQNDMGTILKMQLDGVYTKLIDFNGSGNGSYPNGALIRGTDNMLYGTTSLGGVNDVGTIFKLSVDGSGFEQIFEFSNADGAYPLATLVESSTGALFGTALSGGGAVVPGVGILTQGTLFKIDKDGSNFSNLHNFGAPDDGAFPDGGLVEQNNIMFGITLMGGSNQAGTIFSVNLDGSSYQKVYDFDSSIGSQPRYNLTRLVPPAEIEESIIQFSTYVGSGVEGSGSYPVYLDIDPPAAESQTVVIHVTNGSNVVSGNYRPDYITWPATQGDSIMLTIPAGADQVSFEVVPLHNHISESNELVTFNIQDVTGGIEIGGTSSFEFTILDLNCKNHFMVYPNTTEGVVNISSLSDYQCDLTKAILWSPEGELILAVEGTNLDLSASVSNALLGRRSGVYTLDLSCDEGETQIRLIKK